jgi:hypothetical protein
LSPFVAASLNFLWQFIKFIYLLIKENFYSWLL